MKEPKLQMKTLTELRLDQLETIVSSLIGENAELKERVKKLENADDTLEVIEPFASGQSNVLRSITLPKSLKRIENCAFFDSAITTVKIEHEDNQEKMKSTEPATKSNKKDSCVHNDYVAYLYNTVQPIINPFNNTNVDFEKWKAGMGDEVLNFYNSLYSMTLISDDGEVIRSKCNRCGKEFTVDRRLMTFSK